MGTKILLLRSQTNVHCTIILIQIIARNAIMFTFLHIDYEQANAVYDIDIGRAHNFNLQS